MQKKPEAVTTAVKLPLLPFGSGGVGLLTLYHSWPGQDNASRRMLPPQIKGEYIVTSATLSVSDNKATVGMKR